MAQNFNILTQGLSGHVGDLIFYERNGKPFSRKMPQYGPDSMSAASKQSSQEFAKASRAAKSVRSALNGVWQPVKEETTIFRLNKAVYAALRDDTLHPRGKRVFSPAALHQHLRGFRYNNKAVMTIGGIDTVRQEDGSINVMLPANWQHWLNPPKGVRYIQLQVTALDMDFDNNTCRAVTTTGGCIPLSNSPQSLLVPATPVKATATIVVLQLRFLHTDNGIQANGAASNEQAFIAAVLEPALPMAEKQERSSKAPRIARKKRSAAEILQTAGGQLPSPHPSLPADNHSEVSTACTPLSVKKYKKPPGLVNVE
jgi:hypothetical protein